jgi:hypothetical protein
MTGKCPVGGHLAATVHVINANGTENRAATTQVLTIRLSILKTGKLTAPFGEMIKFGLKAVCDVCGANWPVTGFSSVVVSRPIRNPPSTLLGELLDRLRPRTLSSSPSVIPWNPWTPVSPAQTVLPAVPTKFLGIVESKQVYVDDDVEPRYVDNLKSGVPFKRTIRVSRRWTQTTNIQRALAREVGKSQSVGLSKIFTAELTQNLQQILRSTYSISSQVEHVLEDTFEVEVPPRKRMHILLHWRRKVQTGQMRILLSDGRVIEVPYQVVVGLMVDPESSTEMKKG